MKKKVQIQIEHAIAIIICIAIVGSLCPAFAIDESTSTEITLGSMPFNEIYEDSELYNDFLEAGGMDAVAELAEEVEDTRNQDLAENINNTSNSAITEDDIAWLNEKYDLSSPELLEDSVMDNSVLIYKQDQSSRAVSFYLITYDIYLDHWGIHLKNIGSDTLDRVVVDAKLLGLNSRTWVTLDTTKTEKTNAKTGYLFKKDRPRQKVEEKMTAVVTIYEDGQVMKETTEDNNHTYSRYYFAGGKYNEITAAGGERHHFVSKDALSTYNFNTNTAGAIRMIATDHQKTGSWGSSTAASVYRARERAFLKLKDYDGLIQMELDNLEQTPDPEGSFDSLKQKYAYDGAIHDCLNVYYIMFGMVKE